MRILHMIPTLTGGGAERQLGYLSNELVRRGHDVLVAFVHRGTLSWAYPEVPIVRLANGGSSWSPMLLANATRLIRSFRPDVVQSWIVQTDVIAAIATALTGPPWILREPTTGIFYKGGKRAKLRMFLSRARVSAVAANSHGGLDYWRRNAPAVYSTVIPNGVPIEQIDAIQRTTSDDLHGVFVGRLERLKNVDILLSAVREAGVPLVICGDGPERERLEALAPPQTTFHGFIDDPWCEMKAAAFLASLSEFEGRPNTVLEAFAAGTPVILSDIPAHREIADESSAWFVPLRDVSSTAEAVREIVAGGPDVRARIENARRNVERFSISSMTDAFERLYAHVIQERA